MAKLVAILILTVLSLSNVFWPDENKYGGLLSDRHESHGKQPIMGWTDSLEMNPRLLKFALMTPLEKSFQIFVMVTLWITAALFLLCMGVFTLRTVHFIFDTIGILYMVLRPHEFLSGVYDSKPNNRLLFSMIKNFVHFQPVKNECNKMTKSDCKHCKLLQGIKHAQFDCCQHFKNTTKHLRKLKECFSALSDACKSLKISNDKRSMLKFMRLKKCVQYCNKHHECGAFSAVLKHANAVHHALSSSFNKPKERTKDAHVTDARSGPNYCLDLKLCISEKTYVATFSKARVKLADIEHYVNNELGYPANVFVFRNCGRRLVESDVIELPSSVCADVLLLGGGKRTHKSEATMHLPEHKSCDMCHLIVPKKQGRGLHGEKLDFVANILKQDNCKFVCNKCRHNIRVLYAKHCKENLPKIFENGPANEMQLNPSYDDLEHDLKLIESPESKVQFSNKPIPPNIDYEHELKDHSCDMCNKSPTDANSPIQIIQLATKEKEFSLTVLKQNCTKVCKFCSEALNDLLLRSNQCLIKNAACSEAILDQTVDSLDITDNVNGPAIETTDSSVTCATETAFDCVPLTEDLSTPEDSDQGSNVSDSDKSDSDIPSKRFKKPYRVVSKKQGLLMSPILNFKLHPKEFKPKCLVNSDICNSTRPLVQIPSFYKPDELKNYFPSLKDSLMKSKEKHLLCSVHYKYLVKSIFESPTKRARCILCNSMLMNKKSVHFSSVSEYFHNMKYDNKSIVCIPCYREVTDKHCYLDKIKKICINLEKTLNFYQKKLFSHKAKANIAIEVAWRRTLLRYGKRICKKDNPKAFLLDKCFRDYKNEFERLKLLVKGQVKNECQRRRFLENKITLHFGHCFETHSDKLKNDKMYVLLGSDPFESLQILLHSEKLTSLSRDRRLEILRSKLIKGLLLFI